MRDERKWNREVANGRVALSRGLSGMPSLRLRCADPQFASLPANRYSENVGLQSTPSKEITSAAAAAIGCSSGPACCTGADNFSMETKLHYGNKTRRCGERSSGPLPADTATAIFLSVKGAEITHIDINNQLRSARWEMDLNAIYNRLVSR